MTISLSTNVITWGIAHTYSITCDILDTPFHIFPFFFFFSNRATKTQASCLDDVPVTVERYDFLKESQKPGEEYNAFEQCQQSFGPNFVPHVKPDEPPFEVKKIFFSATTTLNASISTSSLWEFLHWRTLHEKLFNRVAIAFTMIPCLRLDAKSDKNRVKRSSRNIVPFGSWPFGFHLNCTLCKSSSKVGFKKVYVAIVRTSTAFDFFCCILKKFEHKMVFVMYFLRLIFNWVHSGGNLPSTVMVKKGQNGNSIDFTTVSISPFFDHDCT